MERDSINITATIGSGCALGSGGTDVTTYGTLNFGTISSLSSNINVASTSSAGTIIVKCTSGVSFSIALNNGQNVSGSISSGRKMLLSGGSQTLTYQLYRNSSYSTIWGNGSNGGSVLSSTGTGSAQQFVIYGTLFATGTQPPNGQYIDTVTASISY